MTIKKGFFINKFVVFYINKEIYNQDFHEGINTIRGVNAVGKSSLLNLIYYNLGGELKQEEWKYPMEKCTYVLMELVINKTTYCLKRDIDKDHISPIYIFEGTYNQTKICNSNMWNKYARNRSENKQSYSEFMFNLLGWSQSKTCDLNNLTIHQVLRLIYFDQDTDANKIFKAEDRYDSKNMRSTIFEFLFNIDDLSTHNKREEKIKLSNNLQQLKGRINSLIDLNDDFKNATMLSIQREIENSDSIIEKLKTEKNEKLNKYTIKNNKENSEKIFNLQEEIKKLTTQLEIANNKFLSIENDLLDCKLFKDDLNFRLSALKNSQKMNNILGEINFNYCPLCLSKIATTIIESATCPLCKNELTNNKRHPKYIENINDLNYQINQNNKIINLREVEKDRLIDLINEKKENFRKLKIELYNLATTSNERESIIEIFSANIFAEELKKNDLLSIKNKIAKINKFQRQYKELEDSIDQLDKEIKRAEENSNKRRNYVLDSISEKATNLLKKDKHGSETSFQTYNKKDSIIDFENDRWLLGDRISFSDSSNAIKKICLYVGFLLFSLLDNVSSFPNFLILDLECNDITSDRSQNMQRIIKQSLAGQVDYQLILSTSKICSELNTEEFGIGPYYNDDAHILNIN